MDTDLLHKKAIDNALNGAWDQAILTNKEILKIEPKNVAALNRLARAYCEKGQIDLAKKTYQKVLSIDSINDIASKNIKRLALKTVAKADNNNLLCDGSHFLEEPGKTRIVTLTRLTSPKILSQVDSGDKVVLNPRNHFITVCQEGNTYLGSLPEDISRKLINFIKGGNRYEAYVKSVDQNRLEVMVKEVFRSKKFFHQPTF